MDRLLARLERKIGRYAIPHLITFIVGGMALVWVLSLTRPEILGRIVLDIDAVRRGEVWRLVTFLFIPIGSSMLWILVNLYFTWWVGSSLEQHWGAFKFNAFYFVGALGTIVAAVLAGPQSNFWLDASLFLAFATLFPDVQILLFFILPIRVKWLGIVAGLGILAALAMGDWGMRASIVAAMGNTHLRAQLLIPRQRGKISSRMLLLRTPLRSLSSRRQFWSLRTVIRQKSIITQLWEIRCSICPGANGTKSRSPIWI